MSDQIRTGVGSGRALTRRRLLQGFAAGVGALAVGSCAREASPPGAEPPVGASTTRLTSIATTTPSGAPVLLGNPVTNPPILPGTRPDPTRPEGSDLLPEVEHIVVLMMENHSFDNYFGMLGRGDGLTVGPDGEPVDANPDGNGDPVVAFHMGSTVQRNHVNQSWSTSHRQFAGGRNDGSVLTSGREAMGYWTAADVPFYHSLATTFPVCDRYFSAVLAQTYPNRRFLAAATALGNITTELSAIDTPPPPVGQRRRPGLPTSHRRPALCC